MAAKKQAKTPTKPDRKKSLNEPENLSPIPGAAPPEEPQVDENLPPDERREYRREQRERRRDSL